MKGKDLKVDSEVEEKYKGENLYMENEYIKVMKLIKESYDNQKFDTEKFEFYETRREKNKYSTGIIKYNNNKYYFNNSHPSIPRKICHTIIC